MLERRSKADKRKEAALIPGFVSGEQAGSARLSG